MLTLNLVSHELKQKIKLRHLYNLIKKMSFVLIVITLTFSIILLVAKLILQNNFNTVVNQTSLVTGNSKKYTELVKKINSRINAVAQIQKEHITWSYLLEKIFNLTPDGITLTFMKINLEESSLIMRGHSNARSDLLLFKQDLENLNYFANIEFPIQNILKKEDIDFELNLTMKPNPQEWLRENKTEADVIE